MKFLERFALTIFSIIILVISIALLCIMFEVVETTVLTMPITYIMNNIIAFRTALVISIICILLAIKCLFFRSKKQDLGKDGIVLENGSGKLVISKESLENLVSSVAKEIPGADVISSKTILDKDRNLKVYVVTTVSRDMMLKDVSTELQTKIKDAMKRTADLEVKEVNIKIKNITSKKVKKSKERTKEQEEPQEVEEVAQEVEDSESNNEEGEE